MMPLPKAINILGMVYPVTEVENLCLDDGTELYGQIRHTTPFIKVEAKLDKRVKVQALVHEIIHGMFHQTGYFNLEQEENIAHMLGCQIPVLLRSNPELVTAILEGGNE